MTGRDDGFADDTECLSNPANTEDLRQSIEEVSASSTRKMQVMEASTQVAEWSAELNRRLA